MSDEDPEKDLEALEAAKERQRIVNAAKRCLETEDGRSLMAYLETLFGLKAPVFNPTNRGGYHAYDPLQAALTDGARGVIIHINELLQSPAVGDANLEPETTVIK